MFRTDATRVRDILETDITDPQIVAFIRTANLMVTQVLGTSSLIADVLREIETYLAAHYITLRDRRTKQESADGVKVMFEDNIDYEQIAQDLDTTGQLAAISDEDSIAWLARAGSERTNLTASDNLPTV